MALLGATSGAAAAWAVPVGFAVSVIGRPPVVPRGVTALAGGVLALLVLSLGDRVGGPEVGSALTVGVLVAAAGLLRLRDDPRTPGWAVLLGGAVVLAGVHVAGARGLADAAPALGGLIAGLLPMQVGEVVRALRASRSAPAGEPPPSAQQLSGSEGQSSASGRQPSAPERPSSTPAQERP